eukprot:763792-Hanusia_phi.AAC.3
MGPDQEEELARLLNPLDRPGVLRAVNRPLYIVQAMSTVITNDVPYQSDRWTSRERLAVLGMINELGKCVGGCERIVQTPIPLHYARHTGRFMGLFCLTLPFVFIGEMGLLAVPAVACVVWCLYGVQVRGFGLGPLTDGDGRRSGCSSRIPSLALPRYALAGAQLVLTTLQGTWALPLSVIAESIRCDVWEAMDAAVPPLTEAAEKETE